MWNTHYLYTYTLIYQTHIHSLHFNLLIIYLYIQLSIVIYLYIQLSICILLFLAYLFCLFFYYLCLVTVILLHCGASVTKTIPRMCKHTWQ